MRFYTTQAIIHKLMRERVKDRNIIASNLRKIESVFKSTYQKQNNIKARESSKRNKQNYFQPTVSSLLIKFLIQHPNEESSYDENSSN